MTTKGKKELKKAETLGMFKWTPQLSVKEKTIDAQHKTLLEQANKLVKEISKGYELQVLRDTLNFFENYSKEHFSYEEKYMEKISYPGLPSHKIIHNSFIDFFNKFNEKFRSKYATAKNLSQLAQEFAEKAHKFLGEWWIGHIMVEDHKYSDYAAKQKQEKQAKKALEKPAEFNTKKKSKIFPSDQNSSNFDISKIKAEIEKKLKKGHIDEKEAQILEQRAPIKHVVDTLKEKEAKKKEGFVQTGVTGFDGLFEHGIPKGSAVLVAGGAGSGKTIFCLQLLNYHASKGEKCFYMSFEESEEKLIKHMKEFGWNAEKLIKDNMLKIKRMSPFEITRSVEGMLEKEKGELLIDIDPVLLPEGFDPDFVILDSLTAVASAFYGREETYRIYIEQLFRFFEKMGANSFLITETKQIPDIFSTTGVEEFLADGVIVMYNLKRGDIRENAVEVLKMRGEKHQKKIVAMQITGEGIVVYPEQEIFGGTG